MQILKEIIDENKRHLSMGKTETLFNFLENEEEKIKLAPQIDEHIVIDFFFENSNLIIEDIETIRSLLELDFKDDDEKSFVIFYYPSAVNSEIIKKIFHKSKTKLKEGFFKKYIFMS